MRRQQPTLILVVASLLCGAVVGDCTRPPSVPSPVASEDLQTLLADTTAHLLTIGYAEDEPMQVVASASRSRVSPEGNHVVMLAGAAPHVRIFDREGRLHASFLESGEGPGEARRPIGIAISDSEVLVLDAGWRLLLFDLDGSPQAEGTSEHFISSIASDGADGWIAYGPEGEGGDIPWLRSLEVRPDELTWGDPLFRAPRVGDQWVGAGTTVPNVITWSDQMLLYHHWASPPELAPVVDGQIGRGVRDVISYANHAFPSLRPFGTPGEARGENGVVYTLPDNVSAAGAAWLGDGLLWSESMFAPDGNWTHIWYVTPERVHRVSVDGAYGIRGMTSHGEVLVAASDPIPHVFLIGAGQLRAALSDTPFEPM